MANVEGEKSIYEQITEQAADWIEQLEELGASEEELAQVREWEAEQIQNAIDDILTNVEAEKSLYEQITEQAADWIEQLEELGASEEELNRIREWEAEQIQNAIDDIMANVEGEKSIYEQITEQAADWIEQLEELGATEEELNRIREWETEQIQNAIDDILVNAEAEKSVYEQITEQASDWVEQLEELSASEEELNRIREWESQQIQQLKDDLITSWDDIIGGYELSGFEQSLAEIGRWYEEQKTAADELGLSLGKLNQAYELQIAELHTSQIESARSLYRDAIASELEKAQQEQQALIDAVAAAEQKVVEAEAQRRQERIDGINEEISAQQEQISAQQEAVNNYRSTAEEWRNVSQQLSEYQESLIISEQESPLLAGQRYEEALEQFRSADPKEMKDAAQKVLDAGRAALANPEEYMRLFSEVQSGLSEATRTASGKASSYSRLARNTEISIEKAEEQIQQLQAQIEQTSETNQNIINLDDAQREYLEAKRALDESQFVSQIEYYQEELNRLDLLIGGNISLQTAFENYQTALINAVGTGYESLSSRFLDELANLEIRAEDATGLSFAGGGTVKGPSTGYSVPVTFHGVEHITPDSQMVDIKRLLERIHQKLIEMGEDGAQSRKNTKRIKQMFDRATQGQNYLRVQDVA